MLLPAASSSRSFDEIHDIKDAHILRSQTYPFRQTDYLSVYLVVLGFFMLISYSTVWITWLPSLLMSRACNWSTWFHSLTQQHSTHAEGNISSKAKYLHMDKRHCSTSVWKVKKTEEGDYGLVRWIYMSSQQNAKFLSFTEAYFETNFP